MTYTVGPCAAAEACRAYDRHTGQPGDADRHALCNPCLRPAAFAAQVLPRDWLDLEQLLPKPISGWGDGQPHAHGGHPTPINLAAEALQRAIWWTVTAWEDVARDLHRLSDPPPRGVRDGPAVHRACAILAPRLGALSDLPAVAMLDYPLSDPDEATHWRLHTHAQVPGWLGVLHLTRLHQHATAMLGLTHPVRHLPGGCECGHDDLRQDQPRFRGDEQPVYCGACARQWPYDDYRRTMSTWETAA